MTQRPSQHLGLRAPGPGQRTSMPRLLAAAIVGAATTVVAWVAGRALFGRYRELRAGGTLAARRAAHRGDRVLRALEAAGLARYAAVASRERVPVRVGVHAAVHVGGATSIDPDRDIDDVGLLDLAMRRGVRPRAAIAVADPAVDRVAATTRVHEGIGRADFPAELFEPPARGAFAAPVVALVLAVGAVAIGIPALVRPLSDAAPWLAVGALALAGAAWLVGGRGKA